MFEEFNFPKQGEAEAFWQAQLILGKKDARFNEYFRYLIYNVDFSEPCKSANNSIINYVNGSMIFRVVKFWLEKVKPFKNKRKFDILLNPSLSTLYRKTEQELLAELIDFFLDKKQKICVLINQPDIPKLIKKKINNKSGFHEILFLNPEEIINKNSQRLLLKIAKVIANLDNKYISNYLQKNNIFFKKNTGNIFQQAVYLHLIWFLTAKEIQFEMAILRVEWDNYSYAIKETANKRGKKVIGFQHGVISHTLDIPVTVDRFFTFGEQSAQLLIKLNNQFSQQTGQTDLCSSFQPCGSIIDNIDVVNNNFNQRTVLFIDQSVDRAIRFNGLEQQIKDLELLIERVLLLKDVKKVVVRPHPEAKHPQFWNLCKDKYADKFELSNSQITLSQDIAHSSVAIGLFSGALTVAASSGLPSYFLSTSNGYYTPDLNCFRDFILPKDLLMETIKKLVTDEEFYQQQKQKCLGQASQYFINNQKLNINLDLEKLLS